ncbi:MAG: hypothetical protein IT388_12025 [Nitrospirales bacterium]|nr:hypothetical protein [Nitrospirales bacterium]
MEQNDIKALAFKVMQRNDQRNMSGTEGGTDRGTLRREFEHLFRAHAARLKSCTTTLDEIRWHDPEIAEELLSLSRAMDAAWYREDLQGFKLAMQRLEALYLQAHEQIAGRMR